MKKFVCLFLVISLVFACSGSAFAAPELVTGSAFGVDERFLSVPRLAASSPPVGSSTDPYYVRPYNNGSATVYRYSWSTSNPNGSSSGTNQTFTNFADIVTHITSCIANSFLALGQRLHYDNDAIYGRLYDMLSSSISNGSVLNSILSAIQSISTFDTVKIADNSDNGFSQSYLWSKYNPITSTNSSIRWFDGRSKLDQRFDSLNNSLLAEFQYRFMLLQNSLCNYFANVVGNIGSYALTNSDLTTTNLPANSSIANDIRNIGSNLSNHLATLRFVLANDEDIEARNSSTSIRQSYTNDFLKPSGSASASASDFGTLASGSSALSDSFHSSYGASDAFGSLTDQSDGRWDWFTQTTMDNLNSSGNRSSSMLKSNRGYTNFYEQRYRAINHD